MVQDAAPQTTHEAQQFAVGRQLTNAASTSDWTAFHTTETERRTWAPGYDRSEATERKPLLDKPSEPHPVLTMLMDEALLRIMLVSDGAVLALKKRITGSRSASTPTSDLAVVIETLDTKFGKCKTHRKRLLVIKEAQTTADLLRWSPKSDILIRGTQEWRQAIASDPRPRRVVAGDYRCSSKSISAAKKEFGH